MQLSRTSPVVKTSVVPQFDARFLNGIHSGHRLPQSFYAPDIDPPSPPVEKESVAEQVKKAIADILGAKNNDPMAALDTLIRKNHKLEQRAEQAEKERDEFKAKAPDEKDATELAKWRELGESPDKVKTIIDEGAAATQKAAKLTREKALEAAGIDPEKFHALQGADKWTFGERDETKDGKTVKVPTATIIGADGKEVTKAVGELVAEQFPKFADALKLAPPQAAKQVTTFGKSAPAGGGKTLSLAEQIRAEEAAKKPKAPEAAAPAQPQGLAALQAQMGTTAR